MGWRPRRHLPGGVLPGVQQRELLSADQKYHQAGETLEGWRTTRGDYFPLLVLLIVS
jgi:hypothetical protein